MYWSVMLVAACVGAGNPVSEVAHSPEKAFDSYTTAWNTAKDLKRPMLVILNPAAGESGTQSIDGARLLANEQVASQVENYVVAVIDTSTEHGKKVNELFGSKALPRVVVIDKDQKHLLFGTSGVIPDSRIAEVLGEYRDGAPKASPTPVVSTTSSPATFVVPADSSIYLPGTISGSIPGDCPNCRKNWQF